MGTYLSTPVTEKSEESGRDGNIAWGVVDMQGWRKTMEDAHVCKSAIGLSGTQNCSVFGVFDGHGGPEVARFCQLYLVSTLTQQYCDGTPECDDPTTALPPLPKETEMGQALVATFHALDRMIGDPQRRDEIIRLRANPASEPSDTSVPPLSPTPTPVVMQPLQEVSEEPSTAVGLLEQEGLSATATRPEAGNDNDDNLEEGDAIADDDSDEAVGKEEAEEEQDLLEDDFDDNNPEDDDEPLIQSPSTAARKMTVMFQRLLNMGGNPSAGQLVVHLTQPSSSNNAGGRVDNSPSTGAADTPTPSPEAAAPSLVRNGRLICNLPDHPIHAGATATVAVLVGKTLTVANAGDSRAVLCRKGMAYPLSFDHKPLQERELTRIRNAGGFVNQFGRVNGNLNLSRSIGDLKYKQVPNLPPSEQIITAEPDIVQVQITEFDEFLILGCDGIWDCLTNERSVEYVRLRIDSKSPTEIGVEMLGDIISEDPRTTQGIGGDNMTIMIVDLKPHTRTYRLEVAQESSPPSS